MDAGLEVVVRVGDMSLGFILMGWDGLYLEWTIWRKGEKNNVPN